MLLLLSIGVLVAQVDVCALIAMLLVEFSSFFFFQAEDGIRDLVRSRGLGDVYKRQAIEHAAVETERNLPAQCARGEAHLPTLTGCRSDRHAPVSYTHLTLPTIYSV